LVLVCVNVDRVFGGDVLTSTIFDEVVRNLITTVLQGINATVFAYGQTASGKTHTMRGSNQFPGIIPLSITELFREINKAKDKVFQVKVAYLELYNETINDLLVAENKDLDVRESLHGVYIKDLCEIEVKNPEQALDQLYSGDILKKVGETKLNEQSSRSHTVFRLNIQSKPADSSSSESINFSQLNLVDLAGSEGVSRTKAEGIRLREGVNINKSLLALSNVIYRLSMSNGKFINYRDSKLTRILQPALGGNSKTAVICTISQLRINYQESYNTLLFGVKAKKIKNSVKVNEVAENSSKKLEFALKEIESLKNELRNIRCDKRKEAFNLAESITAVWETKVEKLRELIVKRATESEENQIAHGFESMKNEFLKLIHCLYNSQDQMEDITRDGKFVPTKCEVIEQTKGNIESTQKMEVDRRILELQAKLENERQKRIAAEEEKIQLRRNAEQILCESIEECEKLYTELKESIDVKDKLQLEYNLCKGELEAFKKGLTTQSDDTIKKKDDLIALYQSNNEFLKKELTRLRAENSVLVRDHSAKGLSAKKELVSPRSTPHRIESGKKKRIDSEVVRDTKKFEECERKNKQLASRIKECLKEIEGLKTDKSTLLLSLKKVKNNKSNDLTEAMNSKLIAKEIVIQQLLKEKDELSFRHNEVNKLFEDKIRQKDKEMELINKKLKGMETKYNKLYRRLEDSLADENLIDKINVRVSEESNFERKVKVIEIVDQSNFFAQQPEFLQTIKERPCYMRSRYSSPENKENINELNN